MEKSSALSIKLMPSTHLESADSQTARLESNSRMHPYLLDNGLMLKHCTACGLQVSRVRHLELCNGQEVLCPLVHLAWIAQHYMLQG